MANETANKTLLREANQSISVCGYLKEKALKLTTVNGKRAITGHLVLSDLGEQEWKVSYFCSEYTKDGNISKNFKGLETVMNNYSSVADVLTKGLPSTSATKVIIDNAKFTENYYQGRYYGGIRAQFPPKSTTDEITPYCHFETELFFETIKKEFKDDEETGRTIIGGIIPIYNGKVIKANFIGEGAIGDYVADNFVIGKTSWIEGDIVSSVVRTESVTQGFGGDIKKTFEKKVFEYIFKNGTPEQYLPENEKAFNPETIKTALAQREIDKNEKEVKNETRPPVAQTGFGVLPQASAQTPATSNINW